jgi:hypothetical protein
MITSYTSLTSITEDTSLVLDEIIAKGTYTIQFILTGIQETVVSALDLDLDWGDGSKTEYYSKELVYDYKENSIFTEMLYGKLGGTILSTRNHTYTPNSSSFFTNLTAQFLIFFSNGYSAHVYQPIKLVHESYYDNIKQLSIINTQVHHLTSNTVANFQSKYNKQTYITLLERN